MTEAPRGNGVALDAADHREAQTRQGTRGRFLELVRRAPDVEPEPQDRVPDGVRRTE
ncbi:MAG TPA: hypothetical protein VNW46_04610 [Gemmatimonadaceae bacterium]|nr:hypothetical protein [Gemmatimonadaceae bacterium]